MKRHPALQDLSRDHYFVLVKCQIIRRALSRDAAADELEAISADLLGFYESDMVAHFHEEDEFVLPRAARSPEGGLGEAASAVQRDHAWLGARFAELGRGARDATTVRRLLGEIESRLTAHVRFEEERLFEGLQSALSEAELQAMWAASYEYRRAHRAPSACRLKPAKRQPSL